MSQGPYGGQDDPSRPDLPEMPDLYGPDEPFGQPYQQPPGTLPQGWQPPYRQAQPYQQAQPWQQLQPYQQPCPATVQPKNPGISVLASALIPGLGSILNGNVPKGVGILVGFSVCAALSWLLLPILGMLGLWVWGLVDAYQGAVDWNRRHGITS